jgi:ABC-type multidrug transport system fused ATPase/permease subunit
MTSTKKDRIVIIISHSIPKIIDASSIVVLEKGKALEVGNYNDLYQMKGMYFEIFSPMANSLNIKKITQTLE